MSQDTITFIQKARFIRAFFCLGIALSLCSCTTLQSRINTADEIVKTAALETATLGTHPFPLFTARNSAPNNTNHMSVVIEGDGYSWVNRHILSDNPTPKDPIGLRLTASLDTPAIYLARPCQYVTLAACTPALWSYDRFSIHVIRSYMDALDKLSYEHNIETFTLVGFSGGAYIATALAARRDDIVQVSTIAGVLDPADWTSFHDISPLKLHDAPDALLNASTQTRFHHLCSYNDEIAPCTLTQRFVERARALGLDNHSVTEFSGERHGSLWQKYVQE